MYSPNRGKTGAQLRILPLFCPHLGYKMYLQNITDYQIKHINKEKKKWESKLKTFNLIPKW